MILGSFVGFVGFAASFWFAFTKAYHKAEFALGASFCIMMLLDLLYFVITSIDGHIDLTATVRSGVYGLMGMFVLYVYFTDKCAIFKALCVFAVVALLAEATMMLTANQKAYHIFARASLWLDMIWFCVALGVIVQGFMLRQAARIQVKADFQMLEQEWQRILAVTSNRQALKRLAATVAKAQRGLLEGKGSGDDVNSTARAHTAPANRLSRTLSDLQESMHVHVHDAKVQRYEGPVRQYSRKRPEKNIPEKSKNLTAFPSIILEITGMGEHGVIDCDAPVTSLDQVV
jgi:hypothetical protein